MRAALPLPLLVLAAPTAALPARFAGAATAAATTRLLAEELAAERREQAPQTAPLEGENGAGGAQPRDGVSDLAHEQVAGLAAGGGALDDADEARGGGGGAAAAPVGRGEAAPGLCCCLTVNKGGEIVRPRGR